MRSKMRHAILTTLTALLFGATAHASTLFVDGFEHCRFEPNNDNRIYGQFPTTDGPNPPNWVVPTDPAVEFDVRAYSVDPYTGNDCYLKTKATELENAYIARDVPSVSSLYTHASFNYADATVASERLIMGNIMTDGTVGCVVAMTPVNLFRTKSQLSLFFRNAVNQCDAGSRNPFTPCTLDPDDPGRSLDCAETSTGEARCGLFPYSVGSIEKNTVTQISVTEEHVGGEVTCGLWIDGRDQGSPQRAAGNCTVDNWACSTNSDCRKGKCDAGVNLGQDCVQTSDCPGGACEFWDGRCSNWTLTNPYPLDDTVQRCRTTADCGGAAGSGTCQTQTCDISDVQSIVRTWVGPRDIQTSDGSTSDSTDLIIDDWIGSSSSGDGLRNVRLAKFWNIDPAPDSPSNGFTSTGCAGADQWACVDDYASSIVPDDGATYLGTSSGAGAVDEFKMQTNFVTLSTGTCSGASPPTIAGTCSNLGSKTCFAASDCAETVSSSGVSLLAVVRDEGEGSFDCTTSDTTADCDDLNQSKELTLSIYDYSNGSASCAGSPTDCIIGTTDEVDDAFGNDYRPAAQSSFNTAPDGTAWTETDLETLGVHMLGQNSGGGSSMRVTAILGTAAIQQPAEVCVDVLPDVNGDGRKTLCIAGDSTYNLSSFQAAILADLCEPDDILFMSTGSRTTEDLTEAIEGIFDGDSSNVNGYGAKALRGQTCDGGPCTGCDVVAIGIGINDNRVSRTGIYENGDRLAKNFCWHPGHAQHGNPCICETVNDLNTRCIDCRGSGCFRSGRSVGSFCTRSIKHCFGGSNDEAECTGAGDCPGGTCVFSDNCTGDLISFECYLREATCNGSNVCTGQNYWDTRYPGTACTDNADCLVPQAHCQWGCYDVAGCDAPGLCVGTFASKANAQQNWQTIFEEYDARNGDGDSTNDLQLVLIPQAPGAHRWLCVGGTNDNEVCTSNTDCGGGGECDQPFLSNGSAQEDVGCWRTSFEEIEANSAGVLNLAQAKGVSWIHHGRCARANCPEGNTGQCTTDGIHFDARGVNVASECFRDCFENRDGTSSYYYDCDFTP